MAPFENYGQPYFYDAQNNSSLIDYASQIARTLEKNRSPNGLCTTPNTFPPRRCIIQRISLANFLVLLQRRRSRINKRTENQTHSAAGECANAGMTTWHKTCHFPRGEPASGSHRNGHAAHSTDRPAKFLSHRTRENRETQQKSVEPTFLLSWEEEGVLTEVFLECATSKVCFKCCSERRAQKMPRPSTAISGVRKQNKTFSSKLRLEVCRRSSEK